MKRILLLLLLCLALPVGAQPRAPLEIQCYKLEETKCEKLIAFFTAELPKFPQRDWTWIVLGKDAWADFLKKSQANTKIATTIPAQRITLVSAERLLSVNTRVKITVIAHEYGHVQCATSKEREADACGERLLRGAGYHWKLADWKPR